MSLSSRWGAVLLVAALGGLAACGGSATAGVRGNAIKQLPPDALPNPFHGLNVTREDMSDLLRGNQDQRSFASAIGLYGLRAGPRLEATLEIGTLASGDVDRGKLRQSIVSQVGGTRVEPFKMGKATVYRTSARNQSISLWFTDTHFFVLSVRDTYPQARALLRDALGLKL